MLINMRNRHNTTKNKIQGGIIMKKMLCFVITLLVIITCSPSVLTSGEEIRTNDAVKAFAFSDVNRVRGSVGIKFKSDVPASRVYEILQSLCLRAYKTRSADSVA